MTDNGSSMITLAFTLTGEMFSCTLVLQFKKKHATILQFFYLMATYLKLQEKVTLQPFSYMCRIEREAGAAVLTFGPAGQY